MRLFRAIVAAAVLCAVGLGCARDAKTSSPPPSADDKPLGTPKGVGGSVKNRKAG
jgi:hypothetical protein